MLNHDALAQLRQLKQQIHEATERADATLKGTQGRFGFAVLDDGREIFIPPEQMQRAFPGDRVRIVIHASTDGKKPHGELEALLHSPLETVTGRYRVRGQGHFVEPDPPQLQRWIFLGPKGRGNARPGDYVHCRIQRHPFRDGRAQAQVEQVLGAEGRPGLELDYALLRHDLPLASPALDTAPPPPDLSGYRDLRDLPFITIDGDDTRDIDDALAVTSEGDGWRLWVAIADPDAWVAHGGPLEQAARRIGNSLYLPGRTLGMLPPELAEAQCALVAEAPRAAMVCELAVDAAGQCAAPLLYTATIQVSARLGYASSSARLAAADDASAETVTLRQLAALAGALLRQRRQRMPAIPEQPDYELATGEDGQISAIRRQEKTPAHRIVEECMLAANRAVAQWMAPGSGVFIAHDGFRPERLADVRRLCAEALPGFDADPASLGGYTALMHAVDTYAGELPLRAILSRWLQRARLSAQPAPHFGLGLDCYTTFTSPIRKFGDLLLHRLVKARLAGRAAAAPDAEELAALQATMERGRRARALAEQWLQCNYLARQPRQPLAGSVSRIHSSGFGVRLHDTGIEGSIETRHLQGKFRFDPLRMTLQGGEQRFQLGQAVQVEVADIDHSRRAIQFQLLG